MSTPTTRQAYGTCYNLFDKALSTPVGIRVKMPTHDAAVNMRMRMHAARKVDREGNKRAYSRNDPMYGASVYDSLQITLAIDLDDRPKCWMSITPRTADILAIEIITPNPELLEWTANETDILTLAPAEAPKFLPSPISPIGTKPLLMNSDFTSKSPNEESSSTSSTKLDLEPPTKGLRRL